MIKKIKYTFLILFFSFFYLNTTVNATTYQGVFTGGGVAIRTGPGTNYEKLGSFSSGYVINMVDNVIYKNEGGCNDGWYKVYYTQSIIGYVCSSYLIINEVIDNENTVTTPTETDAEFEARMRTLFPASYIEKLVALHKLYPNWNFVPINTNLVFSNAVSAQAKGSISLINTKSDGYKSTAGDSYNWLTDTFKVFEGSSWYAAHPDIVAYYLDPRNFLNERNVFMFEKLNFEASYQTKAAISAVFTTTSYLRNYVDTFYTAGQSYNANPIYLGARVRQETGNDGGTATSGATFTYEGKTYSGLYNMYNIGATTGGNPVLKGLIWANGGTDGSATTYLRPWKSIQTSILGGASYIAGTYISRGQYTNYLQRFNVAPDAYYNTYTHQYMTNIEAPYSESTSSFNSYLGMGILNTAFTFAIPVYQNMPESTIKPNAGNPNHHLKDLKINNQTITGFSHDKNTYEYYVSAQSALVNISATKINDKANIVGTGDVQLTNGTTKAEIKVTAENGAVNTYTINIIKTDTIEMSVTDIINNLPIKSDGETISGFALGMTADSIINLINKTAPMATVTVKNNSGTVKTTGKIATSDTITITNGTETKTYTAVIYGDVSATGDIGIMDLLKVQKHIINAVKLTGPYLKAADVDHDGAVTISDLLRVQKAILGIVTIS